MPGSGVRIKGEVNAQPQNLRRRITQVSVFPTAGGESGCMKLSGAFTAIERGPAGRHGTAFQQEIGWTLVVTRLARQA